MYCLTLKQKPLRLKYTSARILKTMGCCLEQKHAFKLAFPKPKISVPKPKFFGFSFRFFCFRSKTGKNETFMFIHIQWIIIYLLFLFVFGCLLVLNSFYLKSIWLFLPTNFLSNLLISSLAANRLLEIVLALFFKLGSF